MLQEWSLIDWNECTMVQIKAIKALNRMLILTISFSTKVQSHLEMTIMMLHDVKKTARTIVDVAMLFSGNFNQNLPIVTRGTPADEVNACQKRSALWPSVWKQRLNENM